MRAWFITSFASIAMVGLWSGHVGAEPSLAEVLREHDNPELSVAQRMMVSRNVANIETGLSWANTALRAQRMQRGLYCLPDNLEIQPQELIDMLRDMLADQPRLGDRPIGFAVLATLQRGFPCK